MALALMLCGNSAKLTKITEEVTEMPQMGRIGKGHTKVVGNLKDGLNVILYATGVVAVRPAKRRGSFEVMLNSGGHRTQTTKNRMNQTANQFNLNFCVWQRNFKWYVSFGEVAEVGFKDNMMFRVGTRE